ncbi:MAG: LysR family transcriptional regulator [Anaerobutyricum sp.]
MSKSIANLEKEIGFPLFKRSVSGVEPTVEARELHIYFRTVMESYTALWKK